MREVEVEKDKLTDTITNNEPLRIGARNGEAIIKGLVDDVRFYQRTLTVEEARALALNGYLPIVAKSRGNRTDDERSELQRFYKENYATDYLRSEAALAEARKHKEEFYSKIPTTLVMEEMTPPRDTFVLVRGDFRTKGEPVTPGTPAVLPPLPEGPANRLTLARWVVAKGNPLMARVTVNRYWSMFFGTGLVKTINDFGSQGEWPSHPQLLDWLAAQFRDGDEPKPACAQLRDHLLQRGDSLAAVAAAVVEHHDSPRCSRRARGADDFRDSGAAPVLRVVVRENDQIAAAGERGELALVPAAD